MCACECDAIESEVINRRELVIPPLHLSNPFHPLAKHVVSVSCASTPLVVDFAFEGLPPHITRMRRLFDGDWTLNIR